jgi:hypothetical protein
VPKSMQRIRDSKDNQHSVEHILCTNTRTLDDDGHPTTTTEPQLLIRVAGREPIRIFFMFDHQPCCFE